MGKVVADQFRLPDDGLVFDQTNILGAVSQVAGVPTGAVFESGSNANGSFMKFANGTLVCFGSVSFNFLNWTTATYAYPHSFVDELVAIAWSGTGSPGSADRDAQSSAFTSAESATMWRLTTTVVGGGTRNVRWVATGRWF